MNAQISKFSIGWDISRISRLTRCIMQLAIYEILYLDDIPTGGAVSEAVRIAKKYDGDDTGAFVNGILGSFARSLNTEDAQLAFLVLIPAISPLLSHTFTDRTV